MDIQTLTNFFMWCTIINGSLLFIWIVVIGIAPDLIYKTQHMWFPIPREKYDLIMYSFFGAFKLLFLIFNFVPYLILLIIG